MIFEKDNYSGYALAYPEPPLVIPPGSFKGTPQELAQVILEQVNTHPESFDMNSWVDGISYAYIHPNNPAAQAEAMANLMPKDGTVCGTTLCIAGYAQLFVDGEVRSDVGHRAAELLDLKNDILFHMSDVAARAALERLAAGDPDYLDGFKADIDG